MDDKIIPIVEVTKAVEETIENPSISVLAEDLLLAHKLAEEVKEKLSNKHPAVMDIFRFLFSLY